MSIDQIVDKILGPVADENPGGNAKIMILAPLISGQKGSHENLLARMKQEGFARVRVDKEILLIEEVPGLNKNQKHNIDVVVDRLVIKEGIEKRLTDSLEMAISLSEGLVTLINLTDDTETLFSEHASCVPCGISYPEFTPASFSFNSPQGACSRCDGLGTVTEFDPDLRSEERRVGKECSD